MAAKSKNNKSKADYGDRLVARNRRASFDYELGDDYEAGMQLIGSEVRALRESTADLTDTYVEIKNGQAWVHNLRVPTLKHAAFAHAEKRPRKLLLHREEIAKLGDAQDRDRMTIVATRLYFKNGRAKLEIRLAKGKKLHDKRQVLRAKTEEREAKNAMKAGYR